MLRQSGATLRQSGATAGLSPSGAAWARSSSTARPAGCHQRLHDAGFEGPALIHLIEKLQAQRGDQPCGLDVPGSPFADLREAAGDLCRRSSDSRFTNVAAGYLFLQPLARQQRCIWTPGYITPAMFLRDKPYYEALAAHPLHDAVEANALFAEHPPW